MAFWADRSVGPIKAIHPETKRVITVYPQRDAKISHDLDTELRRFPGILSWWVALRDEAESNLNEARHEEHNVSEDLYEEYRAKAPKAATETSIKMAIKRDPRMRKAFRARMDAEDMHRRIKSQTDAIDKKIKVMDALARSNSKERWAKDSI